MNPMLEILVFTLNAIIIYFLADWILRAIEKKRGEVIKHRQAVFFVIILALAMLTFRLLRVLLAAST